MQSDLHMHNWTSYDACWRFLSRIDRRKKHCNSSMKPTSARHCGSCSSQKNNQRHQNRPAFSPENPS